MKMRVNENTMKLLKEQIEQVVNAPMNIAEMQWHTWDDIVEQADSIVQDAVRTGGYYYWLWSKGEASLQVLQVDDGHINETEARLIGLLITSARGKWRSTISGKREDELHSMELGEWIQERIEQKELGIVIPDSLALKSQVQGTLLPILLSEAKEAGLAIPYVKLKKLLNSYFSGEVVLLPVQEDWLILVNEQLFKDFSEESDEGTRAAREMFHDLSQGLYELITNEWGGGGLYLSGGEPIREDNRIAASVVKLRETIQIGRSMDVAEHIFFPWKLQLERFVYSIPAHQRLKFIHEMGDHTDLLMDEEMRITLEAFFRLDCNVSETAKQLYIHRNTMLYRIDKFKQMTGLDVRSFEDAVLVRIGLLLYKVTKMD